MNKVIQIQNMDLTFNIRINYNYYLSQCVQISNIKDGEGFIAVSPEARKRFWLDRARTAAIANLMFLLSILCVFIYLFVSLQSYIFY